MQRGYIRRQLRFETSVRKASDSGTVGANCQLRPHAPRKTAFDPYDRTQGCSRFARGVKRGMVLVGGKMESRVGQHQSGMHASTRSGVIG